MDAALSAAAAILFVGWAAKGAKFAVKGSKLLSKAGKVVDNVMGVAGKVMGQSRASSTGCRKPFEKDGRCDLRCLGQGSYEGQGSGEQFQPDGSGEQAEGQAQ